MKNTKPRVLLIKLTAANRRTHGSAAAVVQAEPHYKLESSLQINSFMTALLCQK